MPRSSLLLGVLALVASALSLGCPGPENPPVATPAPALPPPSPPRPKEPVKVVLSKTGLGFRLSDADEPEPEPVRAPAVALSAADTQRLFDRLPPIEQEPSDVKDFALRESSIPRPRPGETVKEGFPPPVPHGAPPAVAAGPLRITRHAPDGDVSLAPHVTVSFSAPMVPITSLDELAKFPVPVKIAPQPPGKWRWVGTQTAMFQPDHRFPMATDYTVDVDAGTRSATGNVLAEAQHFRFSTPPLTLLESGPRSSGIKLDPLIYARFDQAIDPQALLATMTVTVGDKDKETPVQVRLATNEEMDADDEIVRVAEKREDQEPLSLGVGDYKRTAGGQYSGNAAGGRLLVVKPVNPLPKNAHVAVRFPEGTPSTEGPKRTTRRQAFDFRTYGPFRISDTQCWACSPFSTFTVIFSNAMDRARFDKSMVTVSPPIPEMKVVASGSYLAISGHKKGRTKYTVKLASAIPDVFGQTLETDQSVSFDVGPSPGFLFPEDSEMIVLDPIARSHLSVFSVNEANLSVRLYEVKPEDYAAYEEFREGKWEKEQWVYPPPPGRLVYSGTIHPAGRPDELTETKVDLGPALHDGVGQVLAVVESTQWHPAWRDRDWFRQWVQVTHMGLQALADASGVVAWTTALGTGAPLAAIDVSNGSGSGASGANGLARLLPSQHSHLVARKDRDLTFLPNGVYGYSSHEGPRFFTFDDRKMYKPGEDVHVKGWVRNIGYEKGGDVSLLADSASLTLHWSAKDPRGAELSKGDAPVDALGGFDFVVTTPKNANLGQGSVELAIANRARGYHSFQIQEFRRPEFEVSASSGEGPNFVGEHGIASVDAKYYAGGGLPNAEVEWTVTRSPGSFTPPNREDFAFGNTEGYGWNWNRKAKRDRSTETWKGRTDAQGTHRMRVDFDALAPAFPMSLELSASVTDVNRQQWAASTAMLVHPASVYVGVKLDKPFVNAGESLQVSTFVADLDGKPVAGRPVTVTSARLEWEQTVDGWEQKEVDEHTCPVTSGEAVVRCTLPTKGGGEYRVKAIVVDEYDRKNQTVLRVWVMGEDTPPDRSLPEGSIKIIPDKKTYGAGDTAELLLLAPFAPAEGLLVLERQGIVSSERFHMATPTQSLKVKLDGALTPNLYARVLLAGSALRNDAAGLPDPKAPKRPAFASGEVDLPIPPAHRTLTIDVTPRDKAVAPAGRTTVDVEVKDARGAPVAGAEVAVVVVDESILALSGYRTPDPLGAFYPQRYPGATQGTTLPMVQLAKPSDESMENAVQAVVEAEQARRAPKGIGLADLAINGAYGGAGAGRAMDGAAASLSSLRMAAPAASVAMKSRAPMAQPGAPPPPPAPEAAGGKSGPPKPIDVRSNFSALALFEPAAHTDARGHAEFPVKLPDSLTRYRVMAIAVAGDNQFGSHESAITARLPLMVRPSAPRFLNFGDRFELPVVVQNQTEKPITVDVAVRAVNATITEAPGKRMIVPASDRVEVRFLAAAAKPGTARFQIGAAAGDFADASNIELPVWTPATTEAFATYGVVDSGATAQPVKMPEGVFTQFGGLEVTTSSTALQGLTDAVVYLVHYPFECNEQLSSRILAIASLRDVLAAFKSKDLPPAAVLEKSVAADLDKLKSRQKWDGGWAFWYGEEWPYISIHVAHALARAEAKGYEVNPEMRSRAIGWLRSVESHIPSWYPPEARRAIVAYALYTRRLLKDPDPGRAKQLIKEYGGVDKMNLEAIGWIWPTISEDKASQTENAAIRTFVANRVSETAGAAHFVTSYGDGDYLLLHSDRRADGILLEALIVDEPDSDLIPKLVKGLLGHRTEGRWSSTQENAFVLLGLDRYFGKYEKVTPDFVARVWLGDKYAGDHAFRGRTTEYSEIDVPMRFLADVKEGDLTLAKEGPGRLYYRIGMKYAPQNLRLPPTDQGFTVTRAYEAVEDGGDVRKDEQGVWHVKAGKKVRIRVTMVVPDRRYHVALVDPIPAGFEPMNPALAVTGTIPQDPKAQTAANPYWYWHSTWYEHQNMRDERVEAFSTLVWEGVHEYVYTARATTPGSFVVPPPKAEEMYSPEVFGRGPGDAVVVE